MNVHYSRETDMTIRLNDEEWENGTRAERMIDVLCKDYGFERISFPYLIGEGYKAQDIMSRKLWRWFTVEYNTVEYKLRYFKIVRLWHKLLTSEILERQGIPTDRDSLSEMGLIIRKGKIHVRGSP